MTFFNKKEDVIKIELTPYGRSLMAKGRLMPAYYAFFDDDILYDSEAAGFVELQTEIQTRILQETPLLKPSRCLESPEKLISITEQTEEETYPHTLARLNYLTTPIGTSDATTDYGPAWRTTFIQGEISSSSPLLSGSNHYGTALINPTGSATDFIQLGTGQSLKHIPQINSILEYKMKINNIDNDAPLRGRQTLPPRPDSDVYVDGTYVKVIKDQILCQLLEQNGFLLKEGLEMEVYIYAQSPEETLIPLKFLPTTHTIKNNLLVDESNVADVSLDPSYVEYYLKLRTDAVIPPSDLCKGIQNLKSQNIELSVDIDCEEKESVFFDIYGTRVTSIEECD